VDVTDNVFALQCVMYSNMSHIFHKSDYLQGKYLLKHQYKNEF